MPIDILDHQIQGFRADKKKIRCRSGDSKDRKYFLPLSVSPSEKRVNQRTDGHNSFPTFH
jgi:hypothetical protein